MKKRRMLFPIKISEAKSFVENNYFEEGFFHFVNNINNTGRKNHFATCCIEEIDERNSCLAIFLGINKELDMFYLKQCAAYKVPASSSIVSENLVCFVAYRIPFESLRRMVDNNSFIKSDEIAI